VLVQSLSNVHRGNGICHDQPEVGFGECFARTRSSTEPPHRIHVSEDFWFGRIYETVWIKDFRIWIHILVSRVTPCNKERQVESNGRLGCGKDEELGEHSPDIVEHRRTPREKVSLVGIILGETVWDS